MYYFIEWNHSETGYSPDLPEGTGFLLIAEPGDTGTFGLFQVENLTETDIPHYRMEPVSQEMILLLQSAEQYPPALALAREKMRSVTGETPTRFSEILIESLHEHLANQHRSPYFLARSTRQETGYKNLGGYHWIVGYRPDRVGREISWVSQDYHIYHDKLEDFDCDRAFLNTRFASG